MDTINHLNKLLWMRPRRGFFFNSESQNQIIYIKTQKCTIDSPIQTLLIAYIYTGKCMVS